MVLLLRLLGWLVSFTQTNDGEVVIFRLEPVIVQPAAPTANMKNLLFLTQTDCVLVGDSDGRVSVFQLQNLRGESGQVRVSFSLRDSDVCIQ